MCGELLRPAVSVEGLANRAWTAELGRRSTSGSEFRQENAESTTGSRNWGETRWSKARVRDKNARSENWMESTAKARRLLQPHGRTYRGKVRATIRVIGERLDTRRREVGEVDAES